MGVSVLKGKLPELFDPCRGAKSARGPWRLFGIMAELLLKSGAPEAAPSALPRESSSILSEQPGRSASRQDLEWGIAFACRPKFAA
jgi:hypothetical protein